jgi:hypothetical protein
MRFSPKRLIFEARQSAIHGGAVLGRLLGRNILDRPATVEFVKEQGARSSKPGVVTWLEGTTSILQLGSVCINGNCLDLDYGCRSAIRGWTGPSQTVDAAIALWSHPWMGYYHWLIDVAPKIALFQKELGNDLSGAKLCYPKSEMSFEDETLDLLGIQAEQVINTRCYRAINTGRVGFVMLPGWESIQPAAKLLRERLSPQGFMSTGSRIYLSRKGRRKCINEDEVWKLLSKRGFEMIEDKPRSLAEQISLFSRASAVVGPHGAAFSNLIWCHAATQVIEFFNPNYTPSYYLNLSKTLGLKYHSIGKDERILHHWSAVENDVRVDTCELEALMDRNGIS